MKIIQFIDEHSALLILIFALGSVAPLVLELRQNLSKGSAKVLKIIEWCTVPPGLVAIFIVLQQKSVRLFALYPKSTIAMCLTVITVSIFLEILKKRKVNAILTWLGGLLGIPFSVLSLILLGMYFQAPERFEKIKTSYVSINATKGEQAPDFGFSLVSNKEKRKLVDYKGHLVLLNVWATWCVPCLKEMPDLNELQEQFESEGLIVLNLSDESFQKIESYLVKHSMITTHIRVESGQDVPEFYNFGKIRPTSFLISPEGEVVETVIGSEDISYFKDLVERNL